MFNSIHSTRLFRYFRQQKKYSIDFEIKVANRTIFQRVIVEAHTRFGAQQNAKRILFDNITASVISQKSMGRAKTFNEI